MNVKKGDLAIVVRCTNAPENIGIICTVDKWIGTEEFRGWRVTEAWEVTSIGRPFVCPTFKTSNKTIIIMDRCLRPIRGEPEEEETKETLSEPA